MQITISNVDVQDKGKYQQAVVNYTTKEGKAEKKNVMSFKNKALYSTLSAAQPGDIYDVQLGKNEQGYWEFTSATKGQGGGNGGQQTSSGSANPSPKSNYETSEERAARQVYIIRQSSISNAISLLSVGAKAIKVSDVLATAKTLEDFVFGKVNPTSLSEFVEDTFDVPTIE